MLSRGHRRGGGGGDVVEVGAGHEGGVLRDVVVAEHVDVLLGAVRLRQKGGIVAQSEGLVAKRSDESAESSLARLR